MHDPSLPVPAAAVFVEHGGNVAAARSAFPAAPRPWLDLSTGISRYPYPFTPLPEQVFAELPDHEALRSLERDAANFYGAQDPEGVVAAPGSQALIQWLARLRRARQVGVLGYAYREHARNFVASGAEVSVVEDLDALTDVDVAVVVNPNNPDGRVVAVADLLQLARRLRAQGGLLIVDEAFADFLPSMSLVPRLPEAGAVVLRSFGKSFGLAGIRLGFAIGSGPLAADLRQALGPWAVSGPAIAIGRAAFNDAAWFARVERQLAADADALERLLLNAGFDRVGGTHLFRLVRHNRAAAMFRQLAQAGILVRPFDDRPDWLRFGIPRPQELQRLAEALGTEHAA